MSISTAIRAENSLGFENFLVDRNISSLDHSIDREFSDPKALYILDLYGIDNTSNLKVDFAGVYSIVGGSCGTMCQAYVAINLNTGKVFGPLQASLGTCFQENSELFVVNPDLKLIANPLPQWLYTNYFKITENGFELLKKDKVSFNGICQSG